jgi:hypothetical protein
LVKCGNAEARGGTGEASWRLLVRGFFVGFSFLLVSFCWRRRGRLLFVVVAVLRVAARLADVVFGLARGAPMLAAAVLLLVRLVLELFLAIVVGLEDRAGVALLGYEVGTSRRKRNGWSKNRIDA